MGHAAPKVTGPPPTRESFHLAHLRGLYMREPATITLEQFEAAVEHVLRGGAVTSDGRPYVDRR